MSRLTPFRALLAANLVLLVLLALVWLLGDTRWTPPAGLPPALESDAEDAAPLLPELPVETLAATRERPLFWDSRRPPAAAEAPLDTGAAQPGPDPLRNLAIVGVVTEYTEDDMIERLIVRLDQEVRRIRVGENIGDWTLVAVTGNVAHFQRDGEVRSLSMEYAK